ncbi:Hypothetical predicted protein [Pelobates cultripes]|uniref:Uncharacterized protein n=1 Tax=Pelobates cultripes TaxID=61616 RepID=A0AAD1T5E5_PELCU|nr:Hypothetical predicted protein [Pelobates cultripes]
MFASTWTGHEPVQITLQSPPSKPVERSWQLNETLLNDLVVKDQKAQALALYFTDNESADLSQMTVWEVHKSVLMGCFVQLATQKKKEAVSQMSDFTDRISDLESCHK